MAIGADELERFAQRMNMTSAQAEDLFRRLRDLNSAADRGASAFDAAREATNSLSSSQISTASSVTQLGSSAYASAKSLSSLPEQIAASSSALTSIAPLVNTITNVSAQLAQVSATLGGAALGSAFGPIGTMIGGMIGKQVGEVTGEMVGAVGGVINFFLRESQKVIDSFTQLSSVGATFGGSLMEMKKMSSEVGLSFETLSKIAVDNADSLALLGGGTQGALKLVTNTSYKLDDSLLALYGGFTNLNSEVAEYMASRRRQGVEEMATGEQLTKQTGDYLYMMKELSALTGKSAKIVRSEIEQRMKNAATQLAIDEMTETERTNFEYQLGNLPEALRGVYTDLVVAQKTGNTAVLTEGLKMGATMPGIYNKLENMVSALSMSPEEMKKRFGQEASGLVEETKNYRREFKDQLYLFSAGRVSSDVVKNIDTVLTNLGENLGRLKNLPDDIKMFGEQTGKLKTHAEGFTTQVGQIYKEQEAIRKALNDLVTNEGRFDFALKLTSVVLRMTEKIIEGVNSLLPSLINKVNIEKELEAERTALQKNPLTRPLQATIDRTQQQLDLQIKLAKDAALQLIDKNSPDYNTDYQRNVISESMNQAKQFYEKIEKLKEEQKNILEDQNKSNNSTATEKTSDAQSNNNTDTVSRSLGSVGNPLTVNWKDLSDMLQPYMSNQESMMSELRVAIKDQGDSIRKLAFNMA